LLYNTSVFRPGHGLPFVFVRSLLIKSFVKGLKQGIVVNVKQTFLLFFCCSGTSLAALVLPLKIVVLFVNLHKEGLMQDLSLFRLAL
jgi:hypothetical protein